MQPGRLGQILTIYAWFPLAGVLAILALIARFYEAQSAVRTRYQWYALPLALFGLAAALYAGSARMVGLLAADVLLGLAGATLLVLGVALYRRMVNGR